MLTDDYRTESESREHDERTLTRITTYRDKRAPRPAEKPNDSNLASNAVLGKSRNYPARRSSRSPASTTAPTLGFLIGASVGSTPITLK